MKPLENCCVLITRPKHQCQELEGMITSLGGEPIIMPMIEISDSDSKLCPTSIQKLVDDADKIIFVSKNAVAKLFDLNISLPPDVDIITIGSETALCLKERGIRVHYFPFNHSSSEQLIKSQQFNAIKGKRIIIFAGEDGRSMLQNYLRNKGAHVDKIALYKRTLPQIDFKQLQSVIKRTSPIIITCTSANILQNLYLIFGEHDLLDWFQRQVLITVSPRLKRYAKKFGFCDNQILLSANPSTSAIIETLISGYAKFIATKNLLKDTIHG